MNKGLTSDYIERVGKRINELWQKQNKEYVAKTEIKGLYVQLTGITKVILDNIKITDENYDEKIEWLQKVNNLESILNALDYKMEFGEKDKIVWTEEQIQDALEDGRHM